MRRLHLFAAALVALMLGCSSEQTVKLSGSTHVPAAQGVVRIKSGTNNNTRLKINVEHLARPEQISSGAKALVVWAKPTAGGGDPQNLGALHVDDDLDGELDTVTPHQDFELMITAEPYATAAAPSGTPLLSARIRRP